MKKLLLIGLLATLSMPVIAKQSLYDAVPITRAEWEQRREEKQQVQYAKQQYVNNLKPSPERIKKYEELQQKSDNTKDSSGGILGGFSDIVEDANTKKVEIPVNIIQPQKQDLIDKVDHALNVINSVLSKNFKVKI